MIYLLLGGVGLLIGSLLSRNAGWFFGLALGLMAAELFLLRRRLVRLEARKPDTKAQNVETPATNSVPDRSPPYRTPSTQPTAPPFQKSGRPAPVENNSNDVQSSAPQSSEQVATNAVPVAQPGPVSKPENGPMDFDKESFKGLPSQAIDFIRVFFTTGSVVAKIGVIILFFGIAFLLKYAAQRNMVPIEFRLIGVFLGGLGLLGAGWRLRERVRVYSLILQGGGVGVLYLTLYASARFYHLVPYSFAFIVILALVILSGILAVFQDAKSLAVFGIIGGFLAPILLSTGNGNHVVLFSYYALLNLGIVLIAWQKAWRELNLIGFVFTFSIATLWGNNYYQPRYFKSTEPFLILFFLYYVLIAVLHALRQPPNLKGYVDGTLVFGLPVVAFGLQYGLVRNMPYGLAISALTLGLFYVFLAAVLRRLRLDGLRLLVESFLAFSIVFGSLAIPLALDGRWTSAAWALEGGAILWIGVRQNRLLPRIFGVFLQAGSGVFFLQAAQLPSGEMPVANSFFVGCVLICLAGLFSSWLLTKKADVLHQWERYTAVPLMIWGLVWWFGSAFHEIYCFVGWKDWSAAVVTLLAISFLIMNMVSRRLAWKEMSHPPLLLLPGMVVACIYSIAGGVSSHLFARLGLIAWAVAFCGQYRLLFTCEKSWSARIIRLWHQITLWLLLLILAYEAAYVMGLLVTGAKTWTYCTWASVPGIAVLLLLSKGDRLAWPVKRFREAYLGGGVSLPIAFLFCWTILINLYHADPSPLPYVPVVNPLELTQCFLLLLMLYWIDRRESLFPVLSDRLHDPVMRMTVYGAGFLLLNTIVARTIHFWGHIPYTVEDLFGSMLFQAALSILWGVTALVTTLVATRRASRPAWIAGAAILSLVVIKLFVVDLSGSGTVARIVSFLCVGSLMLLIGYLSPLPPARSKEVL